MNDNPLTPDEYEKLFKLLFIVSQRLEQLFTQGAAIYEGVQNQEIQSCLHRIDTWHERITKEKERIQRIRSIIQRHNQINRKRE